MACPYNKRDWGSEGVPVANDPGRKQPGTLAGGRGSHALAEAHPGPQWHVERRAVRSAVMRAERHQ
eukprot:489803-Prymnesium_polylepis.1